MQRPLKPRIRCASAPIWVAIIALAAPSGLAQETAPKPPVPTRMPQPPAAKRPLVPPDKPDEVRGTWTLCGKPRSVTRGEFFRIEEMLDKLEGNAKSNIPETKVWEFLLLAEEAKALGIEVTDEEIAKMTEAQGAFLANALKQRNEQLGVSEAMFNEYRKLQELGLRLKDVFADAARITGEEVYEAWKKDHFLYRLRYLYFPAEEHRRALVATPPTDRDLKVFWSERKQLQQKFRTETTVSAEIVEFDPSSLTDEQIAERTGGRRVSREEALAYYARNRSRLDAQIPAERRTEANRKNRDASLEAMVTPFSLLRTNIEREILLGHLLSEAFEAVRANPGADLAALATEKRLGYAKLADADRSACARDHARYGVSFFSQLVKHDEGALAPEILHEGSVQYFFRVNGKKASRLPEFEEVKDRLVEEYVNTLAYERAEAEAKQAREFIDGRINEEIRQKEREILDAADAEARTKIERDGIKDPAEQERLRNIERSKSQAVVQKLRADVAPAHFAAFAAEHPDRVKETGFFEFQMMADPRDGDEKPATRDAETFLRTNYYIRAMETGHVTQVLSDPVGQAHYICQLAEKQEPPADRMPPLEAQALKTATLRQQTFMVNYRWSFFEIKKRLGLETK